MRRRLLSRVERIERDQPERCPGCGRADAKGVREWAAHLFEYAGQYLRGDGTVVPPADLVPCLSCGRTRAAFGKVIGGVNPAFL